MHLGMEILLIRHAQPAWVVDGKSMLDPELTALGHQQAAMLAQAAKTWKRPPTELWVSNATRAKQTAAPLAEALGIEPVEHPWLLEIQLPSEWQDAPVERMRPVFEQLKTRTVSEWWEGIAGGETFTAFRDRITGGLAETLSGRAERLEGELPRFRVADPEARIGIVAHGGTNSVLTSELLGLPHVPWSWERLVMAHAAFTRLKATEMLDAHIFGLREHSDANHVRADLRSR